MDIPGTPGNDTLTGADLADVFHPDSGIDAIDGMNGVDEVVLPGLYASYAINTDITNGIVEITDGISQYTLKNVEKVRFADAGLNVLKQFSIFNSVIGDAGEISSASLADGGYVVSWLESAGVGSGAAYFQRYDAFGNSVGDRVQITDSRVNGSAKIAQTSLGNIVVTWLTDSSTLPDGITNPPAMVKAKIFTLDGTLIGNEITVVDEQGDFPNVYALSDGGFAVLHLSLLSVYNADATLRYKATLSDANSAGIFASGVASLPDGRLLIAYIAPNYIAELDSYKNSVGYLVVSQSGVVVENIIIAADPVGEHLAPWIFALPTGGWIVTYGELLSPEDSIGNLYQQQFDSSGSKIGQPVQLVTNSEVLSSQVLRLSGGGYVVAWYENGLLFCQRYTSSGEAVGAPIDATTPTDGGMASLILTALQDGGWLLTWTSITGEFWTPDGWAFPPEGATNTGYGRRFAADGNSYSTYSLVLYGDGTDQVFVGGDGNDLIVSAAGTDVVTAGAGNDVVFTGLGNDLIVGGSGAGDDYYDGGEGEDAVRYLSATAGIAVDLSKNSAGSNGVGVNAGIGRDQLFGIENVVAGNFDDVVIGDAVANRLSTESGNDQVRGNGGDDFIDGGAGEDTAIYAGVAARYTVTRNSDGTWTVVDTLAGVDNEGSDTLANIEKLAFSDGLVTLSGKTKITGTANSDRLNGTAADEDIFGLAGNDRIFANGGDDLVDGGVGNDFMDGGANTASGDTVSYASATAGVIVSLAESGDQNTRGAGRDTLRGFENLVGSEFNDRLSGNRSANTIAGGSGDDFVFGDRGADTLEGGNGRDRFVFQSTSDTGNTDGTSDVILDFTKGADLIDLSAIDASGILRGNNSFVWSGAADSFGTSTNGELRYAHEGSNTVIYGDTDRDAASEFRIVLKGVFVLDAGDFIL